MTENRWRTGSAVDYYYHCALLEPQVQEQRRASLAKLFSNIGYGHTKFEEHVEFAPRRFYKCSRDNCIRIAMLQWNLCYWCAKNDGRVVELPTPRAETDAEARLNAILRARLHQVYLNWLGQRKLGREQYERAQMTIVQRRVQDDDIALWLYGV
jgi:hypothetical protein